MAHFIKIKPKKLLKSVFTRRFMFGLALLFVYVFFCPFSILIALLGEEGAGLCAYRRAVIDSTFGVSIYR